MSYKNLSQYRIPEPILRYAVVRRWTDDPHNLEILEYFETIADAKKFIRKQPENRKRFYYQVMKWE
jgi:hypothetical protein